MEFCEIETNEYEETLYRGLKISLEFKGGSYKLNQENISEKEKEFISLINKISNDDKKKIKQMMKALKKSS